MRGPSKSATTMLAPWRASPLATALPRPLPPPTTTATRREKLPSDRGPVSGLVDTLLYDSRPGAVTAAYIGGMRRLLAAAQTAIAALVIFIAGRCSLGAPSTFSLKRASVDSS